MCVLVYGFSSSSCFLLLLPAPIFGRRNPKEEEEEKEEGVQKVIWTEEANFLALASCWEFLWVGRRRKRTFSHSVGGLLLLLLLLLSATDAAVAADAVCP